MTPLWIIDYFISTAYFISSILIAMSIRKLWINRAKFFLILRHPLLSIFFISICLLCNILNLMECMSPSLLRTDWGRICFLSLNTLRISAVIYTLYILFHAIVQQYTVLHRLNNNANNNNIQRLLFQLIQSITSHTAQHENVTRSIFIVYNLSALIPALLFTTQSSVSLVFLYILLTTPQFVLLDAFTLLMYRYTPKAYEDMFNLKQQWNYIALAIVLPLNAMMVSFYLFPSHFALMHRIFDLILLFKFTWTISTYPITLHLQSERQRASMIYPDTWQECLCKDDGGFQLDLLNIPTDDAISYINSNMFTDSLQVSMNKLEWFMREFGNPSSDVPIGCISEFLFVAELSQIKAQMISILGPSAKDHCGVMIPIPDGLLELLPSCLLLTHLSQYLDSITVDNIYDILVRLYLKYMNYDTTTVPICHSIAIYKLDAVYDKLTAEYPRIMCLTQPMTALELSVSRSQSEHKHDAHIKEEEEDYKYTNSNVLEDRNATIPSWMEPQRFHLFHEPLNEDFDSSLHHTANIVFDTSANDATRRGVIDSQALRNIYTLIRTYDDILSDCARRVQNCYQCYKSRHIQHYNRWHALI